MPTADGRRSLLLPNSSLQTYYNNKKDKASQVGTEPHKSLFGCDCIENCCIHRIMDLQVAAASWCFPEKGDKSESYYLPIRLPHQ